MLLAKCVGVFRLVAFVHAEVGVTLEQILEPSYWAHIAPKLTAYDEIRVITDDEQWVAYLLVLFAERNFAKVKVDRVIKIDENAVSEYQSDKLKVDWKGAHQKFSVIRLSDSKIIHSGCKTRDEATQWMRQHEKTIER